MTEQHYSLFNEEVDASLIEKMTLATEQEKWPEEMRSLYLAIAKKLQDMGVNESLALPLLSTIADCFGGGQVYMPKGAAIKRQLRDIQIWQLFNGHNIRELAKRFDVSDKTVYEAIARMRRSERRQYQPDLFN